MFGGTIGTGEILIVLVVALVIFGPKRLPGLGKDLGRGMRDFKRAISGEDGEERKDEDTVRQAAVIAPTTPVADATPGAPKSVPADDAR